MKTIMTNPADDEIRVAIAEFCGIFNVQHSSSKTGCYGYLKDGNAASVPDYLNDLNAMHEAEKMLDVDIDLPESPRYAYSLEVYNICVDEQPFRATARQRALALYRVIKQ